jgi:hypothetical protein
MLRSFAVPQHSPGPGGLQDMPRRKLQMSGAEIASVVLHLIYLSGIGNQASSCVCTGAKPIRILPGFGMKETNA